MTNILLDHVDGSGEERPRGARGNAKGNVKERNRTKWTGMREESGGGPGGSPLITGLDLIMVANGGRVARFSLDGRIERGGR